MRNPTRSVDGFAVGVAEWPGLKSFKEDCRTAFKIQKETGKSFWLPDGQLPKSGLEAFAAAVHEYHLESVRETSAARVAARRSSQPVPPDAGVDGGRGAGPAALPAIGCEWWVQVRGEASEEGDAIGFHWDRDEELADDIPGTLRHPDLATVTYLTAYGAPTVVIDQVPLPQPTNGRAREASCGTGAVSHPAIGKHIAFDGELLHGVPPELMGPQPETGPFERVTFLVNLWLTDPLSGIEEFPPDVASTLNTPAGNVAAILPWAVAATDDVATVALQPLPAATTCRTVRCDADAPVCGFAFGRTGDEEHELWMPVPDVEWRAGETVTMDFGGQHARTVRKPAAAAGGGGKKKRKKKKK